MALRFEQNTIHHQQDDFASVEHLILSGSNEEIGFKLGELARNHHSILRIRNADPLKNECQKKYLKEHYPIHYQRMRGLAGAYSEKIENTDFDFTCFGNPLGVGACSAVYYPPAFTESQTGILSRNLDLPTNSMSGILTEHKKRNASSTSNIYIVELYPDEGFPSMVNLCFELYGLGLDGINSEGLAVTHLYADSVNSNLYKPTKESGVGINEMLVVQLLLDNCGSVDEAKEILLCNKHFYMLLPTHLLIADRFGESFVWEYSPQHNHEYIINGKSKIQILTNFQLHENPYPDAFPAGSDKSCPFERYKTLEHAIGNLNAFSTEKIKEINSLVFVGDEMFNIVPKNRVRTIYHNVYDTRKKSMEISFYRKDDGKHQRRTEYFRFQLEC